VKTLRPVCPLVRMASLLFSFTLIFCLLTSAPAVAGTPVQESSSAEAAEPDSADAAVQEASQEPELGPQTTDDTEIEQPPGTSLQHITGLTAESEDGNYSFHLWLRGQFRGSYPFDAQPRQADDFGAPRITNMEIQRARIKAGGTVFRPWIEFYAEQDIVSSRLLDLRITVSPKPWLRFRVGQWKIDYNRERVDSSGRQQFVDRSIANREITADRQVGAAIFGRLFPGTLADLYYTAGVFTGNGRMEESDDSDLMWLGKLQWNFFGEFLRNSQSDLSYSEKPVGALAIAGLRNRSPYTRFSSSGGGQLDGFEPGVRGQYELRQIGQELSLFYRGFSLQQEMHFKRIEDKVNNTVTNLRAGFVQMGYFFHGLIEAIPEELEFAGRYGWVDPNKEIDQDTRTELSFAANWFFAGHDNKLTADFSIFDLETPGGEVLTDQRVRMQWDISF
jgi:phosphate-selective porin OprO/OprP